MSELARRRPLFHSERDFQHALARLIQQRHPDAELRLEPRPSRGVHLDLLVRLSERRIAIELKYLVAAFAGEVGGELFELPNQGAQDISRYDVVKDVVRLERLIADGYADEGIALTLTNDPAYWRPGIKASPVDVAFRIHEDRVLNGLLAWSSAAGVGTTSKRDAPLMLTGRYRCHWRHYGTVAPSGRRAVELRYLCLPVARLERPAAPLVLDTPKPVAAPQQRTPTMHASTARDEILLAVADILRRSGQSSFDLNDVLVEMRRRDSRYAESTIRTHVTSRMCVDAPDHHATTFDDFERLDRGRYRLRRPAS
ncbi:DUF7669 domain-containing protein [Dactylosporangium sp. CS-047395]|uniref:DUF7669 domain-containing protein n=1 Tax=Dactylosporangium sp. CS-047395 TaxID=3239936 RepID=UPI003D945005